MEPNQGLLEAVASDNLDLVKQLLADGADPCAKNERVRPTPAPQEFPLT